MDIRESIISLIRDITGNPNAGLWSLRFNENDVNSSYNNISYRHVSGNTNMHDGKIRTSEDADKDANEVIRGYSSLR